MIANIPPVLILVVGGLITPLLRGLPQKAFMLLVPILGYVNLLGFEPGTYWTVPFLDYELIFGRVDKLSLIFAHIFHIITFIALLYVAHIKDNLQFVAGMLYAGAALGVVFAGDIFTMFLFWEGLTVSAIFLVLARRTPQAMAAAYRYLIFHVLGGLILLAGIILYVHDNGSTAFNYIGLSSLPTYLIFIGFGINSAWPLLHTWLPDTYPEATFGGTIFLSAFTTKTAVYVLARAFPGADPLIWIGAAMVTLPMFYALIENDMRRVLSYSLINQVGFMMVAIGIGTELAVNGAAAHAFTHILYKGLLFMAIGAVLHQTGKTKATDLGGLYKSMPFTCICCMIGAASISAFPLFSGFVSKSLVVSAAAEGHMVVIWFILLFGAAGVFEHAGIKVPFFTFFAHDSGIRVKEAPLNMRFAMGIAAALCILIGVFPNTMLYPLLPHAINYEPYTFGHVLTQAQLLFFAGLAFCLLLLSGVYPAEIRAVNLDADVFYRRFLRSFYRAADRFFNSLNRYSYHIFVETVTRKLNYLAQEIPLKVALTLLVPYWRLKGASPAVISERTKTLFVVFDAEAFRVGVTSGCAVLFMLILMALA